MMPDLGGLITFLLVAVAVVGAFALGIGLLIGWLFL